MDKDLHPKNGVRLLLECDRDHGDRASYRGCIYTPDSAHPYRVELDMSGAAELEALAEAGEGAAEKALLNLARSVARAAVRRRDDGLRPWPPRMLRWRGPGRQGR